MDLALYPWFLLVRVHTFLFLDFRAIFHVSISMARVAPFLTTLHAKFSIMLYKNRAMGNPFYLSLDRGQSSFSILDHGRSSCYATNTHKIH